MDAIIFVSMCLLSISRPLSKGGRRLAVSVIAALLLWSCKDREKPLFRALTPDLSGVRFINEIREDSMINMLNYEYLYNGGGVGIGDFNNDGKPDVYLTASLGSNALYLNDGKLRFRDVTREAGVDGQRRWSRGVAVVDINQDGLQDIYVCASTWQDPELRRNLLYVNQGVNEKTGIPMFREMAGAYGIDDTSSTHMAAFFDYDNDGDLDLYLLVNDLNQERPNTFRPVKSDGSASNTDKLFQNNWDPVRQHPVFTDVSRKAGILWEGYGLGVQILDINQDGWKDIYVSNDYLSGNLLYINQRDGSFRNQVQDYFKKGSLNAMGNDAGDINNDGLVDLVETDMAAEDHYRSKMMMNPLDYNWYRYSKQYQFPYQTVRNTLQLNRGPRLLEGDTLGEPVFSEIGFMAGVMYTDWSWSPLLADLDQDGYRDLMVTNGLPKDITDNDYISYRDQQSTSARDLLLKLPPVKINNYVFRNNGNLRFTDMTLSWGWDQPGFSNGMATADFDGDGDLDVLINQINMPASVFENTVNERTSKDHHYLRIQVRGDTSNLFGLGTIARVYYQGQQQMAELTPYRGYLSSVEPVLHFGLGSHEKIDSLVIQWPNGYRETQKDIRANQTLLISQASDARRADPGLPGLETAALLKEITSAAGIFFVHGQDDFVDFNIQRGLPHKFSEGGPPMAVGDLNADGLQDIVVGGNTSLRSFIYFQQPDGRFQAKFFNSSDSAQVHEDASVCLLDAEQDGDLDIYIAAGGMRFNAQDSRYQDHLWINNGKGFFTEAANGAIPVNKASKAVVTAADFDGDGRMDLFVGGAVKPGAYPLPESGFLYRNESANGQVRFRDVTQEKARELSSIGLISSAAWADMDGDRDPDLLVNGEWMGVQVLVNEKGSLSLKKTEMHNRKGWGSSLAMADLDGDGDLDLVSGNYGLNGFFRGSPENPVRAYAKDYDGNGLQDLVLSQFKPAAPHGPMNEYPVAMRDAMAEELPQIRRLFGNYSAYAKATTKDVLGQFDRKGEYVAEASHFESGWWENKGKWTFEFHAFPPEAQMAPVRGIFCGDLDLDGKIDVVLNGNDYGAATIPGRLDAFYGLVMKGDGKGGFAALSIRNSGLFLEGDGRGVAPISVGNQKALVFAMNQGPLKLFALRKQSR